MRSATTSPTVRRAHASSCPTSSTEVAVTTWSPAASVISVSLVTIALPPMVRMPVTDTLRGQLVAGDDRPRVAEALLGVERARQHDPGVGLGEQLLQRLLLARPSRRSAGRRRRRSRERGPRRDRCAAGRPRRRHERTRAPSRGRRGRGPSAGSTRPTRSGFTGTVPSYRAGGRRPRARQRRRPRSARSAICAAMTARKTANRTLAGERVDEGRDPGAERRRRAGRDADRAPAAKRSTLLPPEVADRARDRRRDHHEQRRALGDQVARAEQDHERRHDDDPAADAEESRERSR